MVPRNRNVSNPNLTVVTTTQFYTLSRHVLDHHYTLSLLTSSLQDDVVASRLFNRQQIDRLIIQSLHSNRQLRLAHFTLKFLEIIVKSTSYNFFLNLDANPLQQTIQMNTTTRT